MSFFFFNEKGFVVVLVVSQLSKGSAIQPLQHLTQTISSLQRTATPALVSSRRVDPTGKAVSTPLLGTPPIPIRDKSPELLPSGMSFSNDRGCIQPSKDQAKSCEMTGIQESSKYNPK